MFPIAYLTCELKSRDLSSRILIASHLVDLGYAVVVGQQWSIFSHLRLPIPRGAVLFKSANKLQAERMKWGRDAGHLIFTADEECLPSAVHDYARTTDPLAAENTHTFLALNELHAGALGQAYPALTGKIEVAGSARADLLRAAKAPRPFVGEYLLVNTSFGIIRSSWGDTTAAIDAWMKAEATPPGPLRDKLINDRIEFETAALEETIKVIDWLIAHDSRPVVIRPHPQENESHWITRYGDKVTVVIGSDPVPWMQHAALMIHSESTTGVEAALLGAPVINLSPPCDWRARVILSEINPTVTHAGEAISAISTGNLPNAKKLAEHFIPRDGARRSAELIARSLPAPRPVEAFQWNQGPRPEMHRTKFTVSLDEIKALIACEVTQLDDSIFLLRP